MQIKAILPNLGIKVNPDVEKALAEQTSKNSQILKERENIDNEIKAIKNEKSVLETQHKLLIEELKQTNVNLESHQKECNEKLNESEIKFENQMKLTEIIKQENNLLRKKFSDSEEFTFMHQNFNGILDLLLPLKFEELNTLLLSYDQETKRTKLKEYLDDLINPAKEFTNALKKKIDFFCEDLNNKINKVEERIGTFKADLTSIGVEAEILMESITPLEKYRDGMMKKVEALRRAKELIENKNKSI